jgi:hypothetical protein
VHEQYVVAPFFAGINLPHVAFMSYQMWEWEFIPDPELLDVAAPFVIPAKAGIHGATFLW